MNILTPIVAHLNRGFKCFSKILGENFFRSRRRGLSGRAGGSAKAPPQDFGRALNHHAAARNERETFSGQKGRTEGLRPEGEGQRTGKPARPVNSIPPGKKFDLLKAHGSCKHFFKTFSVRPEKKGRGGLASGLCPETRQKVWQDPAVKSSKSPGKRGRTVTAGAARACRSGIPGAWGSGPTIRPSTATRRWAFPA